MENYVQDPDFNLGGEVLSKQLFKICASTLLPLWRPTWGTHTWFRRSFRKVHLHFLCRGRRPLLRRSSTGQASGTRVGRGRTEFCLASGHTSWPNAHGDAPRRESVTVEQPDRFSTACFVFLVCCGGQRGNGPWRTRPSSICGLTSIWGTWAF